MAVVGLGRAGRARLRALEEHSGARLAAVVGREPSPGQPTLARVLADPGVDAVILCTPDLLHAPVACAALEADKHVVVEYPLASGRDEAQVLFELARARARVLHVEHIELLSPAQAALRESASRLGRPHGGSVHSSGSSGGWAADPRLGGSPALRAVARLHRLVDLFGPARVAAARLETAACGFRLEIELGFELGGELLLTEERAPELARRARWDVRCEHGSLRDPSLPPAAGLFARDLDYFVEQVRTGAASYVGEDRILHVLGLVDEIERLVL